VSNTLTQCPQEAGRECIDAKAPGDSDPSHAKAHVESHTATLTLYTRTGCPLCEEMESAIRVLITGTSHRLARVDVDADPSLKARYGWEVPLLFDGDTELCRHELNLAAFQDWLRVRA
jgi:hypothetical protein